MLHFSSLRVLMLAILTSIIIVQSYLLSTSPKSWIGISSSLKLSNDENFLPKVDRKRLNGLTITGDTITPCRSFKVSGRKEVEFVESFLDFNKVPKFNLPEIAILGRSNVGKSSLLNMLAGVHKNIARVSQMPGRTRCVNLFRCKDPKGPFAMLIDLPGYGFARMAKELRGDISHATVAYLRGRRSLVAALLLIDSRRGYQESDLGVIELLNSLGLPYSVIVTKADKLSSGEFDKCYSDVQLAKDDSGSVPVVMSSSVTGFGKKEIWGTIKHHIMAEAAANEAAAPTAFTAPPEYEENRFANREKKKPSNKIDPSTAVEWYPGD